MLEVGRHYRCRNGSIVQIMRKDDDYEGPIGQQSAVRYALDKVAGEATGG